MIVRSNVDHALDRVVDPCSAALGEALGLCEMGLVRDVAIVQATGEVRATLRLTSACCAYGPRLAAAAEHELRRVSGVVEATVTIDPSSVWTPAAITAEAAERLSVRRATTRALSPAQPHDWSTWRSHHG